MLTVQTTEDVDRHLALVAQAAAGVRAWVAAQTGDPLNMLRRMKFDPIGWHPIEGHALNLVEQINQTWTYTVALAAARQLLTLHPEAGGYRLAPGAHAAQPLDIMSEAGGLVGAETFASVRPANNRKLANDLDKLAGRGTSVVGRCLKPISCSCRSPLASFPRSAVRLHPPKKKSAFTGQDHPFSASIEAPGEAPRSTRECSPPRSHPGARNEGC
jgi:hypothetical protein